MTNGVNEQAKKNADKQMDEYWKARFESSKKGLEQQERSMKVKELARAELEKKVQSGRLRPTPMPVNKPGYAKIPISQPRVSPADLAKMNPVMGPKGVIGQPGTVKIGLPSSRSPTPMPHPGLPVQKIEPKMWSGPYVPSPGKSKEPQASTMPVKMPLPPSQKPTDLSRLTNVSAIAKEKLAKQMPIQPGMAMPFARPAQAIKK